MAKRSNVVVDVGDKIEDFVEDNNFKVYFDFICFSSGRINYLYFI